MARFYWELTVVENGTAGGGYMSIGVSNTNHDVQVDAGGNGVGDDTGVGWRGDGGDGSLLQDGLIIDSTYFVFADNDVVHVALDMDNKKIWFGKNGTWNSGATYAQVEAATNEDASWTHTKPLFPVWFGLRGIAPTPKVNVNFLGPFIHTIPVGYGTFRPGQVFDPDRRQAPDVVLSGGFLTAEIANTATAQGSVMGIFATSDGDIVPDESRRFYWETTIQGSDLNGQQIGGIDLDHSLTTALGIGGDSDTTSTLGIGYIGSSGQVRHNITSAFIVGSYGATFGPGDVIGVAIDMGRWSIWFSKNGVWQGGANIRQIEGGDVSRAAATWSEPRDQVRGLFPAFRGASNSGGGVRESATINLSGPFIYQKPGGFKSFLTLPDFALRAGFVTPNWTEIYSKYSWPQMAACFTWEDLAAGPVPDQDILRFTAERQIATAVNQERFTIGEATVTLDNQSNNYTLESAATPHQLHPGRRLCMKVRTAQPSWDSQSKSATMSLTNGNLTTIEVGSTASIARASVGTDEGVDVGSMAGLFAGYVDSYQQNADVEKRETTISAFDIGELLRPSISTELQRNIQIGSLTTIVVSALGLPPLSFENQLTHTSTIAYGFLDAMSGAEAVSGIVVSGGHYAYVDGRGKLIFKNRNADAGATVQASYSNDMQSFNVRRLADPLYNEIRIGFRGRDPQDVVEVAAISQQPVTIPASGQIQFFLDYQDPGTLESPIPVQSLATLTASTDWRMTTLTGVDVTATGSVSYMGYAMQALVTAYNGIGSEAALVSLAIQGAPLRPTAVHIARAEAAPEPFKRRMLQLDSDVMGDPTYCQSYATYLLNRYNRTRSEVTMEAKNKYPEMLRTELLDAIHIQESNSNVNTDYVVHGLEHAITFDELGTTHSVTYRASLRVNSL